MSRISRFGVLLTVALLVSMVAPVFAQGGPTYITYNSYNGDPIPRAFDEKIVGLWNEAHPDMPV